ncbi:LuxR C-terminal-related transcriptional regulator [Chloroflexota bacterium]
MGSSPVLTTKLYIPQVRPELVPRPRLIERLNERMSRKLTLVSAPAGFGKTTLLAEWVAGCERPVAWVSLDKDDNDPARFWAHLIAALQTIHAGVGDAALAPLQSPRPPSIETLLTGLINELTQVPKPFALVLDDLQVIAAPQVHEALTFLLDHLPPQMHLALSTRADPPWPLARRRARREMTEIRIDELRFTSGEAAEFLNKAMKLDLSSEDVARLEERTEGWIVGLQMAALSMQGRSDLSGFISAFTGTHRFVLDYLVEEVLDTQANDIQDFLLGTSILERMSPPLCDAVTGREDSQAILCRLEQTNLFLVPLDDERRWYRFHHLFADLLRSRLEQTRPDQVFALYHRASQWCEGNGLIAEAVAYALAAGDIERVAHLVAGNALSLIYYGELRTLLRQLAGLPHDEAHSRPWLCVAHAWTLAYAGELNHVEPVLQEAEKLLTALDELGDGIPAAASEGRGIAGHIAAIRAYMAALAGEFSEAADLAREALGHLPPGDLMLRGYATTLLGTVLRSSGDLVGAAEACSEAIAISQAAGDSSFAAVTLCDMASLDFARGRLHAAACACSDVRKIADRFGQQGGRPLPVLGYSYVQLSAVLREWNELEHAVRYAKEGLELCEQWGQVDVLVYAYTESARTLQTSGDAEGALSAMQTGKRIASEMSPWLGLRVEAGLARLWLAQGDLEAASRWAQERGLGIRDELSLQYLFQSMVLARVHMAHGACDEALQLLERLLEVAESAGANGYAIEILVLQAMAQHARRETDPALTALERALCMAEPEGYVRTFLDEGPPMARLLRQAVARGIAVGYASRLLSVLESETGDKRRTTTPAPSALVEPLSERELEVLRLLTTHLSSTEIAQELYISVYTVRTHVKSIYSKLNVHSRRDALDRARELKLL